MAERSIGLRVNGKDESVAAGMQLLELVSRLGFDSRFLVVELNGEPLSRDQREGIVLREGDRLEIVRPVAGG